MHVNQSKKLGCVITHRAEIHHTGLKTAKTFGEVIEKIVGAIADLHTQIVILDPEVDDREYLCEQIHAWVASPEAECPPSPLVEQPLRGSWLPPGFFKQLLGTLVPVLVNSVITAMANRPGQPANVEEARNTVCDAYKAAIGDPQDMAFAEAVANEAALLKDDLAMRAWHESHLSPKLTAAFMSLHEAMLEELDRRR